MAGEEYLVSLDRRRADTAGALPSPAPSAPSTTSATSTPIEVEVSRFRKRGIAYSFHRHEPRHQHAREGPRSPVLASASAPAPTSRRGSPHLRDRLRAEREPARRRPLPTRASIATRRSAGHGEAPAARARSCRPTPPTRSGCRGLRPGTRRVRGAPAHPPGHALPGPVGEQVIGVSLSARCHGSPVLNPLVSTSVHLWRRLCRGVAGGVAGQEPATGGRAVASVAADPKGPAAWCSHWSAAVRTTGLSVQATSPCQTLTQSTAAV